ncbi:hypothetical protein PsorP6_014149 [Peronosclerospora sorghi]|uniref:Uncharacterized protein n=1 Tax=Peronosclerospora sorghi TaxID=230839 RepID=A0ACC0VHM7_9STRA|nr:hypothetical protein PsorP6_014149 [Peronosclerospora sorghi]
MSLRSLMFALFLAITSAVAYTERTAGGLESPHLRDTHSKNSFSYLKSDLLNFVESGENMLLSASKPITKVKRDFVLACGVEFDKKKGTIVPDHVNSITDNDDIYDSIIAAKDFVASDRVVGSLAIVP